MPTSSEAEEHLRVIRSLMEKATVYRAISAEAAALGGALAIGASFAFGNCLKSFSDLRPSDAVEPWKFILLWLGVLVLTGIGNMLFLYRGALDRREAFISSGMRVAFKSLAPGFVVAGACTAYLLYLCGFLRQGDFVIGRAIFEWIVPVWIICYGLGLLATSHFAPKSLWWLGWAFLIAGLFAMTRLPSARFFVASVAGMVTPDMSHAIGQRAALNAAQCWMAGTFGLFHLVYAACTWPRGTKSEP